MRYYRQPKMRVPSVILILLTMFAMGCDGRWALVNTIRTHSEPEYKQEGRVHAEPFTVPDGPPEELAALVKASQQEADELAEQLSASRTNGDFRLARLKQRIDHGVAAAEKLAQSSAASEEQRQLAQQWKLSLLYKGAKLARSDYLPRLKSWVADLQNRADGRPLAAMGAATVVELQYLSVGEPGIDALPALVEYAQSYPECSAGVALFQQYGEQLERADRPAEAMQCYRTAVNLYGRRSETASVRDRLISLEKTEQANIRRSQDRQSKLSVIRSQLGNWEDGYFVIYAREVQKSSGTNSSLYHFDYQVFHGPDVAASYIAGLKPNWQWELIRRFPDTLGDFRQATALAEELTKKRAYIRY